MRGIHGWFIGVLAVQHLAVLCASRDFDFFYFVQQWPGSYCDTRRGCCYPKTGKPAADFSIHGLWPNYNDGSYPSNCDSQQNPFDPSEITDLTDRMQRSWPSLACPNNDMLKFWSHEWNKHGTCSESVLDQHGYFETALNLKKKVDLLQILAEAGINPDGNFYNLRDIKVAISEATGYTPGIECNVDGSGNSQLYQVYLCVDKSGPDLIKCPVYPRSRCDSTIEFPSFTGHDHDHARAPSTAPSTHTEL
ncbi:PREDICTED: ribonuclease 1-like [Nelumbo nucifera]|uniref:Ribonuclease 1-like n=1 Tax=Nelumbo nucifera TaxID=4432 RepID=A0A1U7ZV89_NELNU|nr:PREDICTED: ribonuclease 1-like [Nelumbo nucifera]